MDRAKEVDVFEYRDYRAFLRDVYQSRKRTEYGFSYRAFAKRAGSSAPNYLKLVAAGQRNLTAEMAGRFAAALGLNGESAGYFCDLVAFNQAATAPERERCYQRLQGYRRYRNAFRLDAAHAAYHSEWYVPAIRELAACRGFREDPKWIARQLRPSITARQAQQALGVLEQLGLLVRDAEGQLVQHEPVLSTGDDQPLGHHIATFHRSMLERAGDALDSVAREEREIAALTVGWMPRASASSSSACTSCGKSCCSWQRPAVTHPIGSCRSTFKCSRSAALKPPKKPGAKKPGPMSAPGPKETKRHEKASCLFAPVRLCDARPGRQRSRGL